MARKAKQQQERTVTIKCQRLNAESKEYEEVEVEVPAPVYETLRFYNEQDALAQERNKFANDNTLDLPKTTTSAKRSLASKIKGLFMTKA